MQNTVQHVVPGPWSACAFRRACAAVSVRLLIGRRIGLVKREQRHTQVTDRAERGAERSGNYNMTMRWYIVHAYSNFENKVADSIHEQASQRGLEGKFEEILVGSEDGRAAWLDEQVPHMRSA